MRPLFRHLRYNLAPAQPLRVNYADVIASLQRSYAMGKRSSSSLLGASGDERPTKVSRRGFSSKNESNVDSDGNAFWDLSGKRRIVIQDYKGKWFVNLREYFEDKSGEMKPGKKGITLSLEQYEILIGTIPAINKELEKRGVRLAGGNAAEDEAEAEGEEEKPQEKPAQSTKKEPKAKKANIEATSDEGEEDED